MHSHALVFGRWFDSLMLNATHKPTTIYKERSEKNCTALKVHKESAQKEKNPPTKLWAIPELFWTCICTVALHHNVEAYIPQRLIYSMFVSRNNTINKATDDYPQWWHAHRAHNIPGDGWVATPSFTRRSRNTSFLLWHEKSTTSFSLSPTLSLSLAPQTLPHLCTSFISSEIVIAGVPQSTFMKSDFFRMLHQFASNSPVRNPRPPTQPQLPCDRFAKGRTRDGHNVKWLIIQCPALWKTDQKR